MSRTETGLAVTRTLATPDDTRELGRRVASQLRPGDLVLLVGPLGAGKTVFAQGVGDGLGVSGQVTSPTFVISRVHRAGKPGDPPLVHVDAYRLGGVAEVDDLDLDADLERSVTLVEWGGGLVEHLAPDHLEVRLRRGADTDVRTAELVGHGTTWTARLEQLRAG
ncbi:MAG: tRNA (adenosine(37)-N6)-threonylcarbamoyltransferase complex ATPase subunit type 1 TsaE [Micromonosporaceae bacterium]